MPENNHEVKRFWTALEVVFFSMQITYPITYFPSNWNILTFFTDLFRFILYYFVQAEFFDANLRFQKKKNFEETLCLQPRQFASISLQLHLYTNYCSSVGFRWRQKCRFWIPTRLPFWAPFSDFLFQCFNARKLWEMLQLIKVTQHALTA